MKVADVVRSRAVIDGIIWGVRSPGKSHWMSGLSADTVYSRLILDSSAVVSRHIRDISEHSREAALSSLDVSTPLLLDAKRFTESLERAQRVRLDRVIFDWEQSVLFLEAPPKPPRSLVQRFRDWLNCRRERESFDIYLSTAHRHEAVARRSARGSRGWFSNWREHALAALRLGINPRELVELLRSAPIEAPERSAPRRRAQHPRPDFGGLLERLENVIFPNAPGARGAFRQLATGDGLTTARI